MGAGGLRRSAGARLFAESARVLQSGAAVARRQDRRNSARVKIFLYYIGKPKDPHANALAEDFLRRAARYSSAHMREIRPERFDLWAKHPAARKIFLDPAGKSIDSAAFAALTDK